MYFILLTSTIRIQYFLALGLFGFCTCILRCLLCIVVGWPCVFLSSYVYLLHYVCIDVFTSDAGLLARSQYSVVVRPATSTQVFLGFPVPVSKC